MNLSPASRIDIGSVKERFAADGAVSIPAWIDPTDAIELRNELVASSAWMEIFRGGEKVYEMPSAAFASLPAHKKLMLQQSIHADARLGLQYRYRAIRCSESSAERAARGLLLDRFTDHMNTPAVREVLGTIVGHGGVNLIDAQATDYRAGDFLTSHDDAVSGKGRVAAYVFGLTERWQADWGGLLLFEDGEDVTGYVPGFNVLRVFAVPLVHHVSVVAPWVDERRISITGWLRAVEDAPMPHGDGANLTARK